MASPTGGQWVFGLPNSGSTFTSLNLATSLGNGVPFPAAVSGAFNIEVFTAGTQTTADPGFQATATDPGAQVLGGLLTGSPLVLSGGSYVVTDTVVGSSHTPGSITLGSGAQTIVGAAGDSLTGGSGSSVLNAIAGTENVVGGTAAYSVFGGAGDTIVGNAGATSVTGGAIVGTLGSMAIQLPAAGNFIVSSGAGDTITAASGNANALISGAAGDTINMTGNTGTLTLIGVNGLSAGTGTDKITAGSGTGLLIAGIGDTLVGGAAGQTSMIDAQGGASLVIGSGGTDIIGGGGFAQAGSDTISALSGNAALNMTAGAKDSVNLTGNTGAELITGATSAAVTVGGGSAGVVGSGSMSITMGVTGTDTFIGSSVAGAGDTITGTSGSAATLNYNPGTVTGGAIGGSDLINLTGSTGSAVINAFSNGAVQGAVNDTIIAGNGADSVFGGGGDRTGISSIGGGASNLWLHATSVAGAAMAFGTNDAAAGTSSAKVTVGAGTSTITGSTATDFQVGTDSLFYQNESSGTNATIAASAQSVTVNGLASSVVTLPDGTSMTLVGVTTTQLTAANTAGTLFKV
jgi:hypothetical protein